MDGMLEKLELYGYVLLFFSSFGGSLGIVASGVLSALGKMDLLLSILVASVGNICGSLLLVGLVKCKKRLFWHRKTLRKIAKMSLWLKRYGLWLILGNKYIYGFKTILPLVVGMSGYSLRKFVFWNTISALLWACVMGLGGFWASNLVMLTFESLRRYSYLSPLILLLFALFLWLIFSRGKVRRAS